MPNIIVSEASGRFGQLYGALQAPLASFIERQAELTKADCLALADVAVVMKSTLPPPL